MYLTTLREWTEAKLGWIGLVVGLVGIVLTVAALEGFVWISAAIAFTFLVGYPVISIRRRWHLYGRNERISQVALNTFLLADIAYMIVRGLTTTPTKGTMSLPSAFGLVGIDVILVLLFILLYCDIPKWGRERKKCPNCFTPTVIAAKACGGCGYHWPEKRTDLALD